MTSAWFLDDAILTDATGAVIICDECPCDEAPQPSCCLDGVVVQNIYVWGYLTAYGNNVEIEGLPHCLPSACSLTTNGAYVSYGIWSGGTFDWNNGTFTKIGTIGCANVKLIATCIPGQPPANHANQFRMTIDFDIDSGYIGGQVLINTANFDNPNFFCDITLGGYSYTQGGPTDPQDIDFYLTTRDPATGIVTDDAVGSIIPTVITFMITVLNSLGVPTPYTCDLIFAPRATNVFEKEFGWLGWLSDCAGGCTRINLWFDEGSGTWNLTAVTHGSGNVAIYSGTTFPTFGMSTQDWPSCGAGTTTTPMWSITE